MISTINPIDANLLIVYGTVASNIYYKINNSCPISRLDMQYTTLHAIYAAQYTMQCKHATLHDPWGHGGCGSWLGQVPRSMRYNILFDACYRICSLVKACMNVVFFYCVTLPLFVKKPGRGLVISSCKIVLH